MRDTPTPAPGAKSRSHRAMRPFSTKDTDSTAVPTPRIPVFVGEGAGLPLPVIHSALANAGPRRGGKKSARIDGDGVAGTSGGGGLKVHWAKVRKRLGNGTAPSSSEVDESTYTGGSSMLARPSRTNVDGFDEKEHDEVDEIVVDRGWMDDIKSSVVSHSEGENLAGGGEKSAGSGPPGGTATDRDSSLPAEGFWTLNTALIMLRYRLWPTLVNFFDMKFYDEQSEKHYRKETWFMEKSLALWSSLFLILNWVLTAATLPPPLVLADKIFFYGVAPLFTVPVLLMVMYDLNRHWPILYQVFVGISVWSWSLFNLLSIYFCGFYDPAESKFTCGGKDFLGTFIFVCALPTIGLFGLKVKRLSHLIGTVSFFVIGAALILHFKKTWYRNLLQSCAYHIFLLYVHYMRETAERRLYVLRDQLKVQFRATQKAQVNERKAADSKRRLTSYVFHEVRVPLNTALLATQNMAAAGVVERAQEIEFKALEGSLSMMSKVLNDVLDFNRMDSGRFENVSKPYPFHQVMRSLFIPLRLATDAKNLTFDTDLDESIDVVARQAAYKSMGLDGPAIAKRLAENPEDAGMVVGDEMRLRQIVNNLASNACKFTPPGGKLHISTRLLVPAKVPSPGGSRAPATPHPQPPPTTPSTAMDDEKDVAAASEMALGLELSPLAEERAAADLHDVLSANHLDQHNERLAKPAVLDRIVVRIEVTDTGCGIQSQDMARNKLFSAFNQTEQGRQQGGKGTGLGLALVRQIVKRSGGRLGVRSKVGQGSTFWVELPLGVGAKAMATSSARMIRLQSLNSSSNDIDIGGMADLSPSKFIDGGYEPEDKSSPAINALTLSSAALRDLMDQHGRMVSLPIRPGEESNPALARMAIVDPTSSPAPTFEMQTPANALSMARDYVEASPPTSSATRERPGMIQLPPSLLRGYTYNSEVPTLSTMVERSFSPASVPPVTPQLDPTLPVLVVDDDPLTRMLMKRLLTRLGCRVSTAENGEVALEMLMGKDPPLSHDSPQPHREGADGQAADHWSEDCRYAVVFLDNQMPKLSGLQAVARLRQAQRTDFVVGVTGNALLSDQEEYLDAGADYVLTKPVLEKSLQGMLTLAKQRRKGGKTALETYPCTP